jgi:hypothetical protein
MGVCNTNKHKHNMGYSDRTYQPIVIKQNKISDKTIFDGI